MRTPQRHERMNVSMASVRFTPVIPIGEVHSTNPPAGAMPNEGDAALRLV
eukprot:CAMPEP_0172505802 /NCGR_PEP_ID=MMETSP1066-20121228/189095_1 /TAXON_ID=671091 /ORGANISM="Coscinodiscus wailesii, Strain CCMP2513" /LENGTH=49 /DNA_ID=CAMNT_0013282545 /DNA_START=89 /DNA_END=238 /DNA_ORIENTATION=-